MSWKRMIRVVDTPATGAKETSQDLPER